MEIATVLVFFFENWSIPVGVLLALLEGKRCILRTVNISMSYMNYFHHHSKFLVTCSLTSHTQLHKPAAIFCTKELRAYTSFKTISYLFSLSLGMERRKVLPTCFFLFPLLRGLRNVMQKIFV